jgi:glycosyltransferase involved in cell wall biosynthesis
MGKRLQAAILRNLAVIPAVACDSEATLKDFVRLTGREAGSSLRKILLGFEGGFHPEREQKIRTGLAPFGLQPGAYLLHVGSSQRRKNREGILQVVERLGEKWSGQLVFAGEPLTGSQRQMARRLGVESRVVEINDVDDGLLRELYSGAHALLFPSFCEGFGWPILEAQACGCPVITADNTSLPEVAGEGALVFDADDIDGMAHAVLSLEDAETKASVVRCGFDNLKRFTVQRMATEYVTLYEEALATG